MRLVTFEHEGRRALGAVDGERVVDLRFPGDMVTFVAGGDQALAWAASKLADPGGRRRSAERGAPARAARPAA